MDLKTSVEQLASGNALQDFVSRYSGYGCLAYGVIRINHSCYPSVFEQENVSRGRDVLSDIPLFQPDPCRLAQGFV